MIESKLWSLASSLCQNWLEARTRASAKATDQTIVPHTGVQYPMQYNSRFCGSRSSAHSQNGGSNVVFYVGVVTDASLLEMPGVRRIGQLEVYEANLKPRTVWHTAELRKNKRATWVW